MNKKSTKGKVAFELQLNPSNEEEAFKAINLAVIIFVIMLLGKFFSASVAYYLGTISSETFDIGGDFYSFFGISLLLIIDVLVIFVSIIFLWKKKSFWAACILLILTSIGIFKLIDAYFISKIVESSNGKLIFSFIYIYGGLLAVISTYKLKQWAKIRQ